MNRERKNGHKCRKTCLIRKRRTKQQLLDDKRRQQRNQQYMEAVIGQQDLDVENVDAIQAEATEAIQYNEEIDAENNENENCSQDELNANVEDLEEQIAQLNMATASLMSKELFKNSKLTRNETLNLLQLYRQKHGLSDAAFGLLLDMLKHAILPEGNTLPRTLRSFNKEMQKLSSRKVIFRSENFIIYDVRPQLTKILERNFASLVEFRTQLLKNPNYYDYCGELMRENMLEYISLALATDGGPLTKSAKISVWPIIAQILDLPPKLQKSIANVVLIGIFVGTEKPDWHVIFEHITPQFTLLKSDEGAIEFANVRQKVRIIEFLADNQARAQLLKMREPPAYMACPYCQIVGARDEQNKVVIYPYNYTIRKRTNWIPNPGRGLVGNGIEGESALKDIIDLLANVQTDLMHTSYGGSIERALIGMVEKNKKFFDAMVEPKLMFHKPAEIKRKFGTMTRTFGDIRRLKTNEYRIICHFILPVILPCFGDLPRDANWDLAVNMLLLCCGLAVLAGKNLTRTKIDFAHRCFCEWLKTMPNQQDLTFKSHMHQHYAELTRRFGASTNHTCFFLESCVGFVNARVTCPRVALKQIEERLHTMASCSEEDFIEFQQYFSTIKCSTLANKFKFPIYGLPNKHQNYIRSNFANVHCAKCIKLDYFIIKSRVLTNGHKINDSIIYVGKELRPAIAELFFQLDGSSEIQVLIRYMDIAMQFSRSLAWVNERHSRTLLTDPKAFPNCHLVNKKFSQIYHIKADEIAFKGLAVDYNDGKKDKRIIFPMNVFDHD